VYDDPFEQGAVAYALGTIVPLSRDMPMNRLKSVRIRLGKTTWITITATMLSALLACKRAPIAIAVIPRACGTALWEPEHSGAAGAARARGLTVYWNAPTRPHDVQKQIALLEKVVALHYRGIVLAPDETLALRTPIKNALATHIPIVVVGTELGIDPDSNLSYVLNDEIAGGRLAARRLGLILDGQGTVAILGLDPKLQSMSLRERSFEDALASEFPRICVVARRPGQASAAQEQETTVELLQSGATPDALVALSAEATRGAYYALVEFNRAGMIHLIGFDQDLLPPIRNGGLDSVVAQDTYEIGRLAIKQIDAKLYGGQVPNKLMVQPKLLTRENIDSPDMREVLTAHWWGDS
jgi:ribose transport system substrate-binding protein